MSSPYQVCQYFYNYLFRTTTSLVNLSLYHSTDDLSLSLSSAESFFKKSLEMRESVSGPESADVAQSLNNLAALYNDTKQYDKAQPLYEQALAIRRKVGTETSPTLLHTSIFYD